MLRRVILGLVYGILGVSFSSCVTTPKNEPDTVLANSTRDAPNHPLWTTESTLKKYLKENEDDGDKGKFIYRIVSNPLKVSSAPLRKRLWQTRE